MKKFLQKIFSNDNVEHNELSKKRNIVIVIIGLVFVILLFLGLVATDEKIKKAPPAAIKNQSVFQDDTTKDIARARYVGQAVEQLSEQERELRQQKDKTKALEKELNDIKSMLKEMTNNHRKNIDEMDRKIKENNQANFKSFNPPKPQIIQKDDDNVQINSVVDKGDTFRTTNPNNLSSQKREKSVFTPQYTSNVVYYKLDNALQSINITKEVEVVEEEKVIKKNNFTIPAGAVVKAVILSGFDAPTMAQAKTNPAPVLLKVTNLSILANNYSQDIKDCFVLAEGYGDLSSERAYLRTNTLSCVTNNEKIITSELNAYISGEDGKNGLRGRVVTKQGALIGRSIIAGFLSGVGEAFSNRGLVTITNADGTTTSGRQGELTYKEIANQGFGKGVSNAAEKIADFYLKMADQISPVIEISANRDVDIILTRNMTIDLNTLEELKSDFNEEENSEGEF